MRRFPLQLIAALALAAACGSSDGASWVPAGKASAVHSGNIFALAGLNLTYGVSLSIGNLTTTGSGGATGTRHVTNGTFDVTY